MSQDGRFSGSQMGLAFLAGAVVGVAAAVLLSTEKGQKLRGALGDKAKDLRERTSRAVGSAREAFQDALHRES